MPFAGRTGTLPAGLTAPGPATGAGIEMAFPGAPPGALLLARKTRAEKAYGPLPVVYSAEVGEEILPRNTRPPAPLIDTYDGKPGC